MTHSKGISWIDDCRIPHNEEIMVAMDYKETKQSENGWNTKNRILEPSNRGRFPANLLVSDDMLNDGVIKEGNKPYIRNKNHRYSMDYGLKVYEGMNTIGYADTGTNSRYYDIDKWFDKIINYE
jgi:hypothetical protein